MYRLSDMVYVPYADKGIGHLEMLKVKMKRAPESHRDFPIRNLDAFTHFYLKWAYHQCVWCFTVMLFVVLSSIL